MIAIDEVYRRLRDEQEDEWYLMSVLWQLDPAPPATQAPARLQRDVERIVEHIAAHWPQSAIFTGVRTLERLGQVTLPHDETYFLAMISALGDRWDAGSRAAAIRADEELRESLLWRAFEVEGGGEVSLTNVDKYSRPGTGWSASLQILAADGTLPRDRLLDACLRALARDFSAYRAGFFSQLYSALSPAPDELDQPGLIRLLASPIPSTVSFAVRHLTAVERAGGLDDTAFVEGAGAALTVPAKGTPLAVLKLLDGIRDRSPSLSPDVTALVGLGLEHRHREVQERALGWLRSVDARSAVAGRLDLLEPTVAREAAAWLGSGPTPADAPLLGSDPALAGVTAADRPGSDAAPAGAMPAPSPGSDPALARVTAAARPGSDRTLAGVTAAARPGPDPALAGAMAGPSPGSDPALAGAMAGPSPGSDPTLAGATAAVWSPSPGGVERSADERVAALLAGETEPYEIERFLADFAAGNVSGDLRGPARRVLRRGDNGSLRHNIAALLLGAPLGVQGDLLAERLAEVQGTGPRTLLATPSDATGWLDPGELVARLHGEPLHHDLIAALLRLHPDGRDKALRAAADVPGQAGAAVRYALGAPAATALRGPAATALRGPAATTLRGPAATTLGAPAATALDNHGPHNAAADRFLRPPVAPGDAALWIAAARARAPLADDPLLLAAGLDAPGQGRAAALELLVTQREHQYQEGPHTRTYRWCEQALNLHAWAADQPTVPSSHQAHGPDWVLWTAQIWPHDAEVFCAGSLEDMLWATGTDRIYTASAILDALAAHPGRMGPLAAGVLVAGLTAAEVAHRTRAAEAFAALVPSGRLDPAVLAGAMVTLAHHATAGRWSSSLRASGEAGAVADVLARALPWLPREYPGLHTLLTTLHEESVRAGRPPEAPELHAWLAGFAGSSKAARTARSLLAEAAR